MYVFGRWLRTTRKQTRKKKRWRSHLNDSAFKFAKEQFENGYGTWFECAKKYIINREEDEPDESDSEVVWFAWFGLSDSSARKCYELYKDTLLREPLDRTILRFLCSYVEKDE